MTEDELRRLDGNLGAQVKSLDEEIKKLDEKIEEIGLFKRLANRTMTQRSKEKLRAQREKMEQYRTAIQSLQTAISVGDPTKRASVAEQQAAYNNLLKLEETINYDDAVTPLAVSGEKVRSSLRNTFQTIYNRRVSSSYGRILLNGLIVAAGVVAAPIALNFLGLPALVGAISPVIWGALGVTGIRSITHLATKFIRNRNVKKQEPPRKYEEMYPTLKNVKGFTNTLSYFRGLRRSVGKRFDAMTDSELFKRYKTAGFAPIASLGDDTKGDGKDKEDTKKDGKSFEASIAAIVAQVVALEVSNKDEVNKFIDEEFSVKYAAISATPGVEIKNRDLLELCNSYLKIVKAAHEGAINETALESFLNMEGTSENFKSVHDRLVMKLESLLQDIFKDTLSDSVKEMFEKYKHTSKGKSGGAGGDKPDPEDLDDEDEKKKDGGKKDKKDSESPKPGPGPEPGPKPDPTDDLTPEKVKEEIGKIIDKMSRSTTSVDFAECLKELNELIKNSREKGVAVTYDEETKMILTLLRSYTSFLESIRSGIYDNKVFYNNLRDFLDPEKEVGSERVRNFRSILIRQLNSLVRDELKINDTRLTGLIDYGFSKRTRGSFGTTASQVALIQNLERFDFRDFSPENIALARNMLDEMREIERMKTPENEFHLDSGLTDTVTSLEMFSSVARDRERLSAQIKACQSVISNPAGYAEPDARATIENCIRTYYHIIGFVNHVVRNAYSGYTYQDRSGNSKNHAFTDGESGIEAAIDLKLLSASQITSLKKIMEFYKNSELRATTGMTAQSERVDEYLSGYKARR